MVTYSWRLGVIHAHLLSKVSMVLQKTGDHAYFAYQGSHFIKNEKTPSISSIKMVTMYMAPPSKIGDHAYFAYPRSHFLKNIKTQTL